MSVRGSDETQSNPESHQTMIAAVIDFGAEELHEECITEFVREARVIVC